MPFNESTSGGSQRVSHRRRTSSSRRTDRARARRGLSAAALAVGFASLSGLSSRHAQAQTTVFWDTNGNTAGIGGSGTWDANTTSDWSTSSAGNVATSKWTAGNIADFGGAAGNVTVSGTITVGGITFDSTGNGSFTLAGAGGFTLASSGATINQSSTFGETINNNFTGSANTLTLTGNGTGAVTLTGTINGVNAGHSISLDKEGTSTFILANTAAYSNFGTATVGGGTLQIGNGGTSGLFAFNITDNVNGTVAFNHSDTVTYANTISGSGAFNQMGPGTLIFSTNQTYTGLTTISGGTLQLGNGSTTGSVADGILDNAALVFNRSDNITYAGNISGTGAMTKSQANILTLTGTNTYTGLTTISGGTLQVGNAGTTGSITGNIADASALVFNRSNTFTYVGNITGTGSLTQAGAGTTILTGADTRTGATTISGGTLQIGNGSNTGSVPSNITNNAALAFNRNDTVTYSGVLSGTGSLTQSGPGTLVLTGNNILTGVTTISPSGTLQLGNGSITGSVAGNIADNGSLVFNRSDNPTYSAVISGSGAVTQSGSGTLILTGANTYTGDTTIASGTLQLGNASATGSISGNVVDNSILAFNRSNALTFAGAISGTGSLIQSGSSTLTLAASNTYSGGTTINSGAINFSDISNLGTGGITLNGGTLQWAAGNKEDISSMLLTIQDAASTLDIGANNVTFSNSIGNNGTGSLTKLGSGVLTLTVSNTYTGNTNINAGTINFNDLGNFGPGNLSFDGGTLQWASGNTSDISSRTVTINAGGATLDVGANNVLLNSPIGNAGAGALTKLGSGTLTLADNNTYTGGTTISSGTLQLGNGSTTGSVQGNITDNSALVFSRSDNPTYSGVISGTGFVTQLGPGNLILIGSNTYIGGTTISAGALQLGNGGSTGSVAGNIDNESTLIVNHNNTVTLAGNISGSGSLTQAGTGTTVLTGSNTHTGGTTISAGTLQIGNGSTAGSITSDVVDNGALAFNHSDNVTFANLISGTGSLTQLGHGALFLTNTNTYSGGTNLNAGTINFSTLANLGTGPLTFNGGTLQYAAGTTDDISAVTVTINAGGATLDVGANNVLLNSPIGNAGAGSLTKLGNGTLTLVGNNTYTGGTTISAGTLQLGNGVTTGSVLGAITDNATLAFNRSDNVTYSNVISGTGTLIQMGPGNLILTASNGYTGPTSITGGALQLGNGGTSGSVASISIDDESSLIINHNNAFTLAANISGTGSLAQSGAGTTILTGADSRIGSTSITNGTLQIGNGSTAGSILSDILDNSILVFNRSNTITYDGLISGTGALTQLGAGTLILTNNEIFTGLTTISAGTLQIGNAGASGSLAGNILDNATLTLNRIDTLTFAGNISGTGALTQIGSGTTILTGADSRNGSTTISAGTLQIGNGSTTGSVSSNIIDNSNLTFSRSDTVTYAGIISGNGALTQLGPGNLVLTNTNTFTGTTIISGGTLQLGNGGSTGSVAGPIADNAALIINHNNAFTYAGNLTGTGTLAQSGTGTTVLTGTDSRTGQATINTGTLQIGNAGATGSITSDITDNSILTFNRNNTATYGGVLSGTGSLNQLGTGTLVLTGNSTFTGTITISAGTLQIGNGNTTGALAGNITDSAALIFNRSDTLTYAGNISGTGSLTQSGSGTTILTGSDTRTGSTTINSGTLQLGNNTATGSIATSITDNGNLAFNRSNTVTFANVISGSGSLTQMGPGTLILTGSNTYTGGTAISGGTLQIGNGSISGTLPAGNVVDNSVLAFNRSNGATVPNTISGTGSLVQLGNATLSITGSNTYTGGTTVSNGSIQIGNGTTSGSIVGNIALAGGAVSFNRSDNVTFSGLISGTGAVNKTGSGLLQLTNSNTYSGGTNINAGILNFSALNQLGAGAINFAGGTLQWSAGTTDDISARTVSINAGGATLDVGANNVVLNSPIGNAGAGSLTKIGSGNLTMNGVNTYTGATNINVGSLILNGSTAAASTVNVASGATLTGSGTVNGNATVTGTGIINFASAGKISGTLTATGGNWFGQGSVTGVVTTASGTFNIGSGATLTTTGGLNVTAGTLAGTGSVVGPVAITGTIAPGASNTIGALNLGDTTLGAGGVYVWKLSDAAGSAGSGWDNINMGLLSVTASSATPFTIKITSLNTQNFDPTGQYTFNIGTYTSTSVTNNFAASKFTLDTSAFGPGIGAYRAFQIQTDGSNHVQLSYYAVPEPSSTMVLLGLGATSLLKRRRRRNTRREA